MQSHPADYLLSSDQFFSFKSCPERSRGANIDVQKKWIFIFPKRYVCQLGVGLKTRKHIPLLYIFDTNYRWKPIFSHWLAKLANMVQDKKVDRHTPPQPWGAIKHSFFWIWKMKIIDLIYKLAILLRRTPSRVQN